MPASTIARLILGLVLVGLPCLCGPASAQKRVALVVGNSAYVHATPLANPANDASDLGAVLKDAGFDIILGLDLDKQAFDAKVRAFSQVLPQADAGVFFYAGHGLQVAGRNHLLPIDARLQTERDLDFESVSLDFILRQMELDREGKTNIIFLDACRDNPLARNLARSLGTRSASVGSGLAQVQTAVGTFIAYSTQPGNVALDGQGRNSPFTAALLEGLREPGRNLTAVMIEVRKQVLATTQGKQVPWDHSALTGDFYFHYAGAPGSLPRLSPSADTEALQQRLQELERELAKRTDPGRTLNLVKLEQLKERVRQLEEANRADQQRIFDTYRKFGSASDATTRGTLNREVGSIQLQMARRGQEQKQLRDAIAQLEADAGASARDGTK